MSTVTIATAQIEVNSDVRLNSIAIQRAIKQAKSLDADIVHFCEGGLSGYAKSQVAHWTDFNFQQINVELNNIAALCKTLNIWAIIGAAYEYSAGEMPYNSLFVISNEGSIINRYDKRKCSHNELINYYTPGQNACIFTINNISFYCLLCIEVHFPRLFEEAEHHNVDCILFSAYAKDKMFAIQLQGHAATYNLWISMSVPVACSQELQSQFIGPDGYILSQCVKGGISIIVNNIDVADPQWHLPLRLARPWRRQVRESAKK